ncbi:MAG: chromosomal replication initiator protein DnaA [Burkholderiaceae bacterium]
MTAVLADDDDDGHAFWHVCTEQLRGELTPQQYSAWIKPLTAATFDPSDRRLRIGAPNRFKLDWVKDQFAGRIEAIAQRYFEGPVQLALYLDVKAAEPQAPRGNGQNGALGDHATAPPNGLLERNGDRRGNDAPSTGMRDNGPAHDVVNGVYDKSSGSSERSRLDPELTFDTFVTGKANQLARAAANQVADNPGKSYNPLFLHGGVGLGKTHLIQAVGNQIISRNPSARIRYIHADQFVADVVRAYQRKAFDNFKQIYHSLDLLLIDDIQFFSRKDGTQEQFFYVFEALSAAKKQIIITSDTYPAEMQGIEERLVSRFGSGLTVAVEPPELEMRVAILLKKAEQVGRPLSDDVAFFVAKHSRSNVRELEGALRKLFAYADFHVKEITIEMAREALKDMLSVQRAQVSVESIQKTVADFYKIKVADMYSQRRPTNIARPRQIAMYFAKELTQKSLPEIGELFGGRDHTTVLHAVRKINELRGKFPELNRELHVLLQTLKG